jgi:hypothetical protein
VTVVWLNGGFGVGKTTTAALLAGREEIGPEPVVHDPEIVGMALARSVPKAFRPPDFQLLPMWFEAVVGTVAWLDERADGAVIVPMTILDPERWDRLRATADRRGVDLATVFLSATPEVLTGRIRGRPDGEGDHDWCLRHRDAAAEAEDALAVDLVVVTDERSPVEVADIVVAHLGDRPG